MHIETLSKETKEVFDLLKDSVASFYLAGGTALALGLGHRISVDLDFFTQEQFSTQELLRELSTKGRLEVDSQSKDTINGSLNGVKISFFRLPDGLLFEAKKFQGVKIADERDIVAMKILAVSGRGSKKDFVDLYFLLRKYSLEDMLGFFHTKYAMYNYNTMHILKSLVYFGDAEVDSEPICLIPIDWLKLKKEIERKVDDYITKATNVSSSQ
ncbi:MAG: nucleotidyl transferase AbiEii/AbiGii toxin family protein [Candidatus Paceibacterota bacterium]